MSAELFAALSEPFPPSAVTWKPGHTTKDKSKCQAMAYADLRAYQERLDKVCGLDWQVEYEPWGNERIIARLTIGPVVRCSTGEMVDQDVTNGMGGTVAEAQAFKRAASMFGLGRYLYDLPSVWVEYDADARRISKAGIEELDKRYQQWYARKMAAHSSNGTPPPPPEPPAPVHSFEPPSPAPVAPVPTTIAARVPEFQRQCADLQAEGAKYPASEAQYGFLAGRIDYFTAKNAHNQVLEFLIERPVSKENRPAGKLVKQLLDWLVEFNKDESTGKYTVPNPKFSPEVVDNIRYIWHELSENVSDEPQEPLWA